MAKYFQPPLPSTCTCFPNPKEGRGGEGTPMNGPHSTLFPSLVFTIPGSFSVTIIQWYEFILCSLKVAQKHGYTLLPETRDGVGFHLSLGTILKLLMCIKKEICCLDIPWLIWIEALDKNNLHFNFKFK
jgi:hypothetical protein